MASHPNEVTQLHEIYQLRRIKHSVPGKPDFYHPTEIETMDKINEIIKTVNYIINHCCDVIDDGR